MPRFLAPLDMALNQIQNVLLQLLGTDPGSPTEGQLWWNTASHRMKVRDNSATRIVITDLNTLDQITAPAADVSLNSHKITNLTAGTAPTDAVNFTQLEQVRQGVVYKVPVAAVATSNVSTSSAPSSIDGYTLQASDRVLLTAQTTASQNGIYVFSSAGAALARADDADVYTELQGGSQVFALNGTANGSKQWRQLATLTSFSSQNWQVIGAGVTYSAGNGMTESPTATFNVNPSSASTGINGSNQVIVRSTGTTGQVLRSTGTAGNEAAWGALDVSSSNAVTNALPVANGGTGASTAAGGRANLGAATVFEGSLTGDGSTTSFTITHSFATRKVAVSVSEVATPYSDVYPDVTRPTTNTVQVDFGIAPTNGVQYNVLVVAKA